MHEAAVAEDILGIAIDAAKKADANAITEVNIAVGEMTGLELSSLEFSFNVIKDGTIAQNAALNISRTKLIGQCNKCGRKIHLTHYNFFCPYCKEGILKIISGREMKVLSIETE